MKIKNLVYTLLVLIIGGFIAYRVVSNSKKGGDSKDKGGKDKPMNVSGIVIKTQVFKNNLSLSGSIEANEQVEIRSEVSGIVEAISFQEGSFVNKGQVLFKVNDQELKAQLIQKAQVEFQDCAGCRYVDNGFRRGLSRYDVHRQALAAAYAGADHFAGQPGLSRKREGPGGGLHRHQEQYEHRVAALCAG